MQIVHKILCISFSCLCVSSPVYGMRNQDGLVITKLKLVLTAGRYVYKEHQAIQVDALHRARTILDLFNISEEQKIAQQLDLYCVLLEKVRATYILHCPKPAPALINTLEESHRSCLLWALAIPSGKISRKPWTEFREVFRAQQKRAKEHFKEADTVHEQYVMEKIFLIRFLSNRLCLLGAYSCQKFKIYIRFLLRLSRHRSPRVKRVAFCIEGQLAS